MASTKFTVALKAYALAVITGVISSYIVLFSPHFSISNVYSVIELGISIIVGFVILAILINKYDSQIAVVRHTEERYKNKINTLDRNYRLLKDYFLAVEAGIICGAIVDAAGQSITLTTPIIGIVIFAAIVAVFAMFCYIIIYGTMLILDWIHLRKRRRLAKSIS